MKPVAHRIAFFLLLLCITRTVSVSTAGNTESTEKELFLTAHISKKKPYAGETVELTYTLFFNGIAPQILDTGQPVHEGIAAAESTPQKLIASQPEHIGDTFYRSAVIKRMTLVPLRPGRVSITGYRVLCIILKDLSIDSDPKTDDSLTLAAPRIDLDVIPLPEPQPAGFGGAVGTFTAEVFTYRDSIPEGSLLKLTASITGKGSFLTFPVIPLSLPEGFTGLETTTSKTVESKPGPFFGSLKKTITLKAEKPGTYTFSPLSFSAFDPERKTYATVRSNTLTLTVVPAQESMPTPPLEEIPQDRQTNPLYRLLFALPFALIAALLYLLLKKRSKSNPTPEAARSPQELRKQLFTAIELSCGFEPEKHTRSELTDVLKKQEIDEDDLRKLLAVLDEFDRLEFAPGEPDKDELENLRQECTTLYAILRSRPSR